MFQTCVNIRFFSGLKFFQDMIFFSETQIKWSYKNGHKSNTRIKALKKYLGNFYFVMRFGDSNKQLDSKYHGGKRSQE